jgi:hypothetical protein
MQGKHLKVETKQQNSKQEYDTLKVQALMQK